MGLLDGISQPHTLLFVFYPSYACFPTVNLIMDAIPFCSATYPGSGGYDLRLGGMLGGLRKYKSVIGGIWDGVTITTVQIYCKGDGIPSLHPVAIRGSARAGRPCNSPFPP